ncbi:DUF5133 domain-containing protein [Streptomyces sp. H27-C3]|uniref:DUF5133 domain-containing protein n=1 Tax=Streptomyces sp. H27-C3 TaxID=3046305 RepID=UPI0032D8C671
MPDSKVLRVLLSRYATARLAHEEYPSEITRLALEDVSYTLCVTTATSDVLDALAAADLLLEVQAARQDRQGPEALAA